MKKLLTGFVIGGLLFAGTAAQADPIGDFFKRLGNSIAHPQKKPSPTPRPRGRGRTGAISPEASPTASPTVSPGALPLTAMHATPTPPMVRPAASAPPAKSGKRDVPYGIPVPGKHGFVTSPFAPNEGYVDVRGFPVGAEVTDPYTGKIFLTP
ncbi:MAG: hypothetical protein ABJB09_05435 [Verrucomicrobiota bacterium]